MKFLRLSHGRHLTRSGLKRPPKFRRSTSAVTATAAQADAGPHLDKVAEDWSNGVDHGPAWGVKLIAAKYHATNTSYRVVDRALEVAGGYGIFRQSGMERLFRDARLGPIHPANNWLAHEFMAKAMLGIDLDTQPRWG